MVIGYAIRILYTWFLVFLLFANILIAFDLGADMPVPFITGEMLKPNTYVGFSSLYKFFNSDYTLGNSGALTGFRTFLSAFNRGLGEGISFGESIISKLTSLNTSSLNYQTGSIILNVLSILGMLFSGFLAIFYIAIAFGYVLYGIFLILYYLVIILEVVIAAYSLIFGLVSNPLPSSPYDYGNLPTYDDWLNQGLRLYLCF